MNRKQVIQVALTGLVMGTLLTVFLYTGFIGSENPEGAGLSFGLATLVINIPILLYGYYVMKEQPEAAK